MSKPSALLTDEEMEQMATKGRAIYDETLKSLLEPEYNRKIVAIHLDSGDYAVADNSPEARRALRTRQPEDPIVTLLIGPNQMDQLARRMAGGQFLVSQSK